MLQLPKVSSRFGIPFRYATADDQLEDVETILLAGRNPSINDAAPEDVWDGGGDYTGFPEAADAAIEILSSSAADAPLGTGAHEVLLVAIDADGNLVEETVTLNGTTPVSPSQSLRRVLAVTVTTSGSDGTNAGDLTVRGQLVPANVYQLVLAGYGRSQAAVWTVPSNRDILLSGFGFSFRSGSTLAAATVALMFRPPGAAWVVHSTQEVSQGAEVNLHFEFPEKFLAGTDIKLRVLESQNSA